jgi:hypothetical protein
MGIELETINDNLMMAGLSIDFSFEFVGLRGLFISRRRAPTANLRKTQYFGRCVGGLSGQSPSDGCPGEPRRLCGVHKAARRPPRANNP